MGVTNQFEVINGELTHELGYHLDPQRSSDFRSLLDRAGLKRTREAIALIKGRNIPFAYRHKALVAQIWALIPPKKTKYRNPEAEKGHQVGLALDREMQYAMAKDGE